MTILQNNLCLLNLITECGPIVLYLFKNLNDLFCYILHKLDLWATGITKVWPFIMDSLRKTGLGDISESE